MVDQSMNDIVEEIEKELLFEIINRLDKEQISEEQASQLANEFLELLPIQDKHELLIKLGKFSKFHNEAKSIYLKYAVPYEEEVRTRKLALMSEHIKKGRIDHALSIAKGEQYGS